MTPALGQMLPLTALPGVKKRGRRHARTVVRTSAAGRPMREACSMSLGCWRCP